jgi:hypothetical protein
MENAPRSEKHEHPRSSLPEELTPVFDEVGDSDVYRSGGIALLKAVIEKIG